MEGTPRKTIKKPGEHVYRDKQQANIRLNEKPYEETTVVYLLYPEYCDLPQLGKRLPQVLHRSLYWYLQDCYVSLKAEKTPLSSYCRRNVEGFYLWVGRTTT
jgi:hypothetical protein